MWAHGVEAGVLPSSSFRSCDRHCDGSTTVGSQPKPRALDGKRQHDAARKAGAIGDRKDTGESQAGKTLKARLHDIRRKALEKSAVPCILRLRTQLVLEVFAGSGHLSKALAGQGFHVVAWDILHSAAHDVFVAHNRAVLLRLVMACSYAHFAPECKTLSIARRAHCGPRALRSSEFPYGLPDLSIEEQKKVDHGNFIVAFTLKCVNRLRSRGAPCAIEQPWTSLLFAFSTVARLREHPEVRLHRISFCAYGTPWRNHTGFLGVHFPLLETIESDCTSQGGVCLFTKRPHQRLAGVGPGNIFWTRIAQPYPVRLCKIIAKQVMLQLQQIEIMKNGVYSKAF